MDKATRIPPQDVDAEKAVIGAMLLDPSSVTPVLSLLQPEYFYSTANEIIFRAILELNKAGSGIDAITVRHQLKADGNIDNAGGTEYLHSLVASTVSSANVEAHAEIIIEKYMLRNIVRNSSNIIEACYSGYDDAFEITADSQAQQLEILTRMKSQSTSSAADCGSKALHELEFQRGYTTGFLDIDNHIRLSPQTLITVGARPRVGKSLFALNVADFVSRSFPVLFFSLEMSMTGLVTRLISKYSGYSVNELQRSFHELDRSRLYESLERLGNRRLDFSFVSGLTAQEIRLQTLNYKSKHPDLALVIVDYAQLIAPSKSGNYSREQEVAESVRGLTQTARDADVCVMPLAQLSRASEMRPDKSPQLSDLRESGSLEQDSDIVILLHRPELYNIAMLYDNKTDSAGKIEARIAKNRNGSGGIAVLGFNGERMRIENLIRDDSAVKSQLENWKSHEEKDVLPF